jgi:hypothetical protein
MLRLKFIILLLFIISINNLQAQYNDDFVEPYVEPKGTNNWFVELGGAALFWSANYEKYLFQNQAKSLTWTGRVGFGFCPLDYRLLNSVYLEKNSVAMPFTTSLVLGKRKEKLEIGAGYTLATKNFIEREVFPTAALGFRVVDNNGTLLRIVYTPHYRDDKVINWFGVSLGRNF